MTLQDSLLTRLDRLGPAKEVAQIGAVIGGEFSYELLRAVHPVQEEVLQRALRSLADAELIYVRGIPPDATYWFKHSLIRDAAYQTLLKSRRKELHGLVAQNMDRPADWRRVQLGAVRLGSKTDDFFTIRYPHGEVLARHWAEAGETEPAFREWWSAGRAAQALDSSISIIWSQLPDTSSKRGPREARGARKFALDRSLWQTPARKPRQPLFASG